MQNKTVFVSHPKRREAAHGNMSFSFNFAAIDLNEGQDVQVNANDRKKDEREQRTCKEKASSSGTAKQHKLETLITSLPSKLSYTRIEVPIPQSKDTFYVYRRDLFDARFQMLHEDEEGTEEEQKSSEEWKTVMAGAATDLVPGVYEGGLKTWECSLDLAGVLAQKVAKSPDFLQNKKVIELGCGTAVPSLYLLSKVLKKVDDKPTNLTLQLCDFNEQVLRMVS